MRKLGERLGWFVLLWARWVAVLGGGAFASRMMI